MNSDTVITFAVVSGKGGTGKTTLSVALAHELSKSGSVLLVDLDFFNRGLSGLFADHIVQDYEVSSPAATLAFREDRRTTNLEAPSVVSVDTNLRAFVAPRSKPVS